MNNLTVIENGLIPIYKDHSEETLVDAKELHEFLEVGDRFDQWIQRRIEKYGFIENLDFCTVLCETPGRPRTDYILKLDTAKEISMVENNSKGRLARRYFIEVEKKYRKMVDDSNLSPELQMFNQMFKVMSNVEVKQKQLENQVFTIKETIVSRDEDWRRDISQKLRKIGFKNGNYNEIIKESYKLLEERAGCKLSTRLENMKQRMSVEGATKSVINKANYLDVIGADKRLLEIYVNIVKQLYIKHAA